MYCALDIARYIVQHENSNGRTVSNLRLQKLLYFVQCAFLGVLSNPCFSDEMEAWDYGPVVPAVYHRYKVYGSTIIPSPNAEVSVFSNESEKQLVDQMLDTCAGFTTRELVDATHRQSPWRDVFISGVNNVISIKSIADYMKGRLS